MKTFKIKPIFAATIAALLVTCTACAGNGAAGVAEADALRAEITRLTAENERLSAQAESLAAALEDTPTIADELESMSYRSFTGYIVAVNPATDTAAVIGCEGGERDFQGVEDLSVGDLVTMIYVDPAGTAFDPSDDILVAVHYTGYHK